MLLVELIIRHHLKETGRKILKVYHRSMLEQARVSPLLPALIDPFSLRPRAEHYIVGNMVLPSASQRRILLLLLWKRHPRLVALNGMNELVKPAVTDLSMGWPV